MVDPKEKSGGRRGTKHCSKITLRENLIKIGATVVRHGRYITFQIAEVAIVKELVDAHGGQVGAESAEGQVRIWFTLPG